VNVGALSPLITVNVEAHVSFWAAYLIPLVYVCLNIPSKSLDHSLTVNRVIVIAAAVFISGSKRFIKTPPHGSAVIDAVKIVTIAVKEGGFENARPSTLQARGTLERHRFAGSSNFTDKAVKDVQSGITACKVRVKLQGAVEVYGD
jgi:POT family proton-dependent oligopeptide transporter